MPNRKLSTLGQKELERIRGRRKVTQEEIAEEMEYAKTLSPIARWIRYSTELGSERNRLDYFATIEGRRELVKRFANSDADPSSKPVVDESRYDYSQQVVKRSRNLLETFIDMFLIG